MSQYTMLGGYKIDVETEPYDKGSFDTDYSKAIQLTIRLSANNSHKEKMECYFIQANDYATFYDICDSVDGDMLDMCYDVKKYMLIMCFSITIKLVRLNRNLMGCIICY